MTASELTELAARVEAGSGELTANDLFYLRSIYRQLREIRAIMAAEWATIGGEVLADNIDWLDCFIYQHERALAAQQQDRPTERESEHEK